MSMGREMVKRPPKWPLDTLEACIRDFLWRRAPGGGLDVLADDIPGMCLAATNFREAVWIACASKRRNGKMHSHQTKVAKDARREFGYRIIERGTHIQILAFAGTLTFEQFHDDLWEIRPEGIGPLTVYDVATRVGAYLRIEPKDIFLHTGARLGWNALTGGMARAYGVTARVPPERWPAPLRQLSADMAEDFLCAYRSQLASLAIPNAVE